VHLIWLILASVSKLTNELIRKAFSARTPFITTQGLPIGLMIYAKPFQENAVLRAGYAFQKVTDWHRHMPDLSWIV
jgi:hypothetical protein